MIKKFKIIITLSLTLVLLLTGCQNNTPEKESDTLKIVATTTMLADLATIIGGEHVTVNGLMGPGIDPHLYQASAGDVTKMQEADVILYNGLHLEGKMGEIFESLSGQDSTVIRIEDGISEDDLLSTGDDSAIYDPHIWFDVSLWKDAAKIVTTQLSEANPEHSLDYSKNLEGYLKELETLDTYI